MKDWLVAVGLSLLAVLAPIKALLIVTGILIVADCVTGIYAAKKTGEKITSAKMRRTVSKMFVYNLCIISGFLVEQYIMDNIIPVAKIISGAIATVELKSLLENSNKILGMDLFSEIMKRLGSKNDKE